MINIFFIHLTVLTSEQTLLIGGCRLGERFDIIFRSAVGMHWFGGKDLLQEFFQSLESVRIASHFTKQLFKAANLSVRRSLLIKR